MGGGWSEDQEVSQPKTSENSSETRKHTHDRPEPNGKNKPGESLSSLHDSKHVLGDSNLPHSHQHHPNSLQNGSIMLQNRLKHWIDKDGKHCFTVYARDLSITWAEADSYWTWHKLNDGTDESSVEVAELMNVCWLEVAGKFDTRKLSPETLYEVSFVVMMKQNNYGWSIPVNVTLEFPNGRNNAIKVDMRTVTKLGQWSEIVAGTFFTSPDNRVGELRFTVHEYDGGEWKRGLVIKGVKIQPKMI